MLRMDSQTVTALCNSACTAEQLPREVGRVAACSGDIAEIS